MDSFSWWALILSVWATVVCIPGTNSLGLQAVFDMGGVKGEVKFSALSGNTSIMVNLTGLITNYTWKIHEFPVVYRGNAKHTCQSLYTGRMYDPSSKTSAGNYSTQCKPSMSNACAIGDLSGKHSYLRANTNNLVDPDLPLRGPSSIFGRSLVLYNENSMAVACAVIDSSHDIVTGVATFRGAKSGITGTVTLRQSRSNSSMDTSLDVNVFYSNDITTSSKNLTLTISDTKLPDEGIPSYEGSACPTRSAKELEIPRKIIVPLARNGPSTERFLLNLGNTPLTGSNSVVGKTFVLRENGSPKICASIYEVLPIEAEGVFDVDGVKGKIHFKQNSELSPTVVTADLRGLKSKANTYHVHVYRVLDSVMKTNRNRNKMCGGEFVAGHWNPYGTKSAKPGKGTVDQYEIGDLSGKYGTIGNSDGISLVYHDYNLPLFGANSILFRSLVIHYNNGSRWACTNINPKNPTFHVKVQSKFIGPAFNGTISVEQASFVKPYATSHITTFFLDLKHMDQSEKTTKSHKWHVHEDEVGDDMMYAMGKRCKTSLAHYNPYQVSLKSNYSKTCGPMNMLRCELGDLSSKLQMYNIGSGKNRFTESENYFFGLNSILGRSIVVHAEDAGAARLGCSSLETDSSNFVQKKLTFKKTRNNNFQSSLSEALNTKRWRVANVKMSEFKDCQRASFILIESTNSNLNKAYEDLKKNWPQSLRDFTPATEAQCKGVSLQATSLILILAFSLLYMFV